MRSWLFIEGDNATKLAKAPHVGADAIVVGVPALQVGETAAEMADAPIVQWLRDHAGAAFARWAQIGAVDTPMWRETLAHAMTGKPDGIVLSTVAGSVHVRQLVSELYELEQAHGIAHNTTKIALQLGETPAAALTIPVLAQDEQPRLAAVMWDAANVARGIGATRTHDAGGSLIDPLRHVRAQTLLLAKAMGVLAVDTVNSADTANAAMQDGFTGIAADNPRQVKAINAAFAECESEPETEGRPRIAA
ncbi:MAG: aldolase/citrate lyase family protein [Parerythrobacter sp.]